MEFYAVRLAVSLQTNGSDGNGSQRQPKDTLPMNENEHYRN